MSDNIKTLQDAANTQPGSFISGGFQAVVSNAKAINTKSGKTMYKANLNEGSLTVEAISFTTDFAPHQGKLVKFVGMGLKRGDDYKGTPQITIGDKVRWIPAGDAPVAHRSDPAYDRGPARQVATGANSNSVTPPNTAIPGVTVGMALNKAVDIALKTGDANEETIYHTASMLIRLSDKLQRGELAPEDQPPF